MSQTNAEKFGGDALGKAVTLAVRFPISMFEVTGTLEHRIHRSQFLKQAAEWYDSTAEECRHYLNEKDRQIIRPPLERLGMAIIDVDAITKAAQPEETEQ